MTVTDADVEAAAKLWLGPLYAKGENPQLEKILRSTLQAYASRKGEGAPRLVWTGDKGRGGGFLYDIAEPSMTPGWRVWVRPDMGAVEVVGGGIVTMKAKSREGAIAAAQADFESRIEGLTSPLVFQQEHLARGASVSAEAPHPPPSADAEGLRERIARIIAGPQADEAYDGRDVQMPDFDEHGSGMKVWQLYEPMAGKIVATLAAQFPPEPGWNEAIEAAAQWHDERADELDAAAVETLSVANKVNLDAAARGHRIYAESIRFLKKPEATQP
jgi:hypothetical protein